MGSGLRAALSLSGGGGRRLRLSDQSDDYHGSAPHRQYRRPLKCPSGAVLRALDWPLGSGGGRSGGGTRKRKAPRGRIREGLGFRSDSAVGRPLNQPVTRFRLESVRQTREDFTDLFFDFDSRGGGVERGLVVAGGEVDGRANLVIQIKGKIWESLLFAWLGRILGQEGAIRKKLPFRTTFVFSASACGTGDPAGMR